jgi:hypothetical protein
MRLGLKYPRTSSETFGFELGEDRDMDEEVE